MIAHLTVYTLGPEVDAEKLEQMMAATRVQLLRVPEVLAVKTGKRVRPGDAFDWFVYYEVETMDKLAICQDDPHYLKFAAEVVAPNVATESATAFEMEPRKDVKYS
jgi:hypothetical protein